MSFGRSVSLLLTTNTHSRIGNVSLAAILDQFFLNFLFNVEQNVFLSCNLLRWWLWLFRLPSCSHFTFLCQFFLFSYFVVVVPFRLPRPFKKCEDFVLRTSKSSKFINQIGGVFSFHSFSWAVFYSVSFLFISFLFDFRCVCWFDYLFSLPLLLLLLLPHTTNVWEFVLSWYIELDELNRPFDSMCVRTLISFSSFLNV